MRLVLLSPLLACTSALTVRRAQEEQESPKVKATQIKPEDVQADPFQPDLTGLQLGTNGSTQESTRKHMNTWFDEHRAKVKAEWNSIKAEERVCLQHKGWMPNNWGSDDGCDKAVFKQHILVNLDNVTERDVQPVPNIMQIKESGNSELTMVETKTHGFTKTHTEGWTVSGGVQAGVGLGSSTGGGGGGGLGLGPWAGGHGSIDYSTTDSEHKSTTDENTDTFRCPAWHKCMVVVTTWHIRLQGLCHTEPVVTCGRDYHPCRPEDEKKVCGQFSEFAARDAKCGPEMRGNTKNCTVLLALKKGGRDNLLFETRLVIKSLRPKMIGCEGRHILLDNGKKYNLDTQEYADAGEKNQKWEFKSHVSEPNPDVPLNPSCLKNKQEGGEEDGEDEGQMDERQGDGDGGQGNDKDDKVQSASQDKDGNKNDGKAHQRETEKGK